MTANKISGELKKAEEQESKKVEQAEQEAESQKALPDAKQQQDKPVEKTEKDSNELKNDGTNREK